MVEWKVPLNEVGGRRPEFQFQLGHRPTVCFLGCGYKTNYAQLHGSEQQSILWYLMILWLRNLDRSQLDDVAAPCDID